MQSLEKEAMKLYQKLGAFPGVDMSDKLQTDLEDCGNMEPIALNQHTHQQVLRPKGNSLR